MLSLDVQFLNSVQKLANLAGCDQIIVQCQSALLLLLLLCDCDSRVCIITQLVSTMRGVSDLLMRAISPVYQDNYTNGR